MSHGKKQHNEFLTLNESFIIGTLGPTGTSSEQAANYFANTYLPGTFRKKTALFPTFEATLKALIVGDVIYAVIPHAYKYINKFYINPDTKLLHIFIYETPSYGLYKRKEKIPSKKICKFATHPAPLPLVKYLLAKQNEINAYKLKLVDSTSIAAKMVKQGVADIAITNEKAAKLNSLQLISMYGPIRMGWSVFVKKGENNG